MGTRKERGKSKAKQSENMFKDFSFCSFESFGLFVFRCSVFLLLNVFNVLKKKIV